MSKIVPGDAKELQVWKHAAHLLSRGVHRVFIIDCIKEVDVATVTSPVGFWTTVLEP